MFYLKHGEIFYETLHTYLVLLFETIDKRKMEIKEIQKVLFQPKVLMT